MKCREAFARKLERERGYWVKELERSPKMFGSENLPESHPEFFRAFVYTPDELDRLIGQLRFGATKENALDKTLISRRKSTF